MLCTVLHKSGGTAPYRPVHQKHPCTLWAEESLSNWKWLKELCRELNEEYRYRYKREINHKSWDVVSTLDDPDIPDNGLTPFAQAMPDEFKNEDAVLAYRRYYLGSKVRFATWEKRRPEPQWWRRQEPEFQDQENQESDLEEVKTPKRKTNTPRKKSKTPKSKKNQSKKKEEVIEPAVQGILTRRAKLLQRMNEIRISKKSKI